MTARSCSFRGLFLKKMDTVPCMRPLTILSGGAAGGKPDSGEEGSVGGIVRFYPLEWLPNLSGRTDWGGYYDTQTPSCNHPIAVFAQSKRLPLIWDELGLELPAWRALLPETRAPEAGKFGDGWIYKPALGRVGRNLHSGGTDSKGIQADSEKCPLAPKRLDCTETVLKANRFLAMRGNIFISVWECLQ